MDENEIGSIIVNAAVAIHKALGPGLLEIVYEVILAHELRKQNLSIERQVPIPIQYDGITFDEGFRVDMIAENKVIVELKSIESVNNAHKKQVLTYLRLTDIKLGFLLNFEESLMRQGITRVVNELED